MKILKIFIGLILMLAMVFSASGIYAHPPSDVALDYDGDTGILHVKVEHSVGDPGSHFVNEYTVKVDNELVYTLEAEKQMGSSSTEAVFVLQGLEKGAELQVIAKCNKFGSRKGVLVVE